MKLNIAVGANQTVFIINYTSSAKTDVNAAGNDVPAYSMGLDGTGAAITLTDAELTTLTTAGGVLVMKSTATQEERRLASKILRVGKNPGYATS